jgi:hypothetical protein
MWLGRPLDINVNTSTQELTDKELYEREEWSEQVDRQSMSIQMFSPGWWSNLMQTVIALGTVAGVGLIISLKSDVNSLMRDAPYVSRSEYDKDQARTEHAMSELEREVRHASVPN